MARQCIIAGNWKMYKTIKDTERFIRKLSIPEENLASIYLAAPFTALDSAIHIAKGTPLVIGAQNMHDQTEGAFTGEISAPMLSELGVKFVLVGHSERRHVFGESNSLINQKVHRALATSIQPIICVGETLEQREAGETEAVLNSQLDSALTGLMDIHLSHIILAYEPVWAIGTGKTATPELAQEAHLICRNYLAGEFGVKNAESVSILYGGSVKPDNAEVLMAQIDIDGVLVGGASLDPEVFSAIIRCQPKTTIHA